MVTMGKLYTSEQIAAANQVDLVDYLSSEGEHLEKSGREWRWLRHDSITIRGNQWYRHKEQRGGFSIEFVKCFYGVSFKEAMKRLLTFKGHNPDAAAVAEQYESKPFTVPSQASNNQRAIDYLIQQRFVDVNAVREFIHRQLIYEDGEYHNVVFAGYDNTKMMKHAHKRSIISNFRGNVEGSIPEYSFYFEGISNQILVFEAPIDLLSYITLQPQNWKQHHYLSLCGLSDKALMYRLSENATIQTVILCLDQDQAGQEAISRMKELIQDQNYQVLIRESEYKDWNEDLKNRNGMDAIEKSVNKRTLRFEKYIRNLRITIKYKSGRTASLKDVLSPFFNILSYKKMSTNKLCDCLLEMIIACQTLIIDDDVLKPSFEYWAYKDKGSLDKRISRLRACVESLKQAYYANENQILLPRATQKTLSECLHFHFELTQREEI